jgi:DNA-binding PadR family transcriptional regulator
MATVHEDGDRIKLSSLDARVLLSLMEGAMGSYEIGVQCEKDTGAPVTHGSLFPAIKRLEKMHFISKSAGNQKNSHVYKITSVGRQVLEWEMQSMKHMTKLFTERSKKPRR